MIYTLERYIKDKGVFYLNKNYWSILITYIAMQFSSILGVPLMLTYYSTKDIPVAEAKILSAGYWIVISFTLALIIILFLLRHERNNRSLSDQASIGASIIWAIGGVFLALFSQSIAGYIEQIMGVPTGSENTQSILNLIEVVPAVMIVSSVLGPILEEIVFRKIVFGTLYKRLNFFVSALISSLIFAVAHMEFVHILLYTAMGFTFAYLYIKTKRILVPIFAHVTMNTLVVLIQSIFKDDIEKYLEELNKVQSFIGGLL